MALSYAARRRWFAALAELEYASMEVFEAAEREPLPPERLAEAALELQPHVRLMEFPVPADLCFGWDSFTPCEDEATRPPGARSPRTSGIRSLSR